MIIKTRVFEMSDGKYQNLSDLAKAMGLSVSQVYRVREGKRGINEKFIIGAKKAFPDCRLDELFYFNPGQSSGNMAETSVTNRYNHIIQRFTALDF
ncbi:MAG: helix-turn-helix transcriptional regulator [Dehalococcoidales bacterium]|nr:helix-turn-helix transcriptional regulator [Dehalococcoidales bacterium]